jgi:uncharacterized membrane protein YozB (DUF420 family)
MMSPTALEALPGLNACLNATSACLLAGGWWAIRARRIGLHVLCMVTALITSSAFLTSYLIYHAQVGSVPFQGSGWLRGLYFSILISHSVLAAIIVPLVVRTTYLALRRRLDAHRGWGTMTLPLWLYVSITGVVVYWMLYRL